MIQVIENCHGDIIAYMLYRQFWLRKLTSNLIGFEELVIVYYLLCWTLKELLFMISKHEDGQVLNLRVFIWLVLESKIIVIRWPDNSFNNSRLVSATLSTLDSVSL